MSLVRIVKKGMEALADEVPGAVVIRVLLDECHHHRRERLADEFFGQVAVLAAQNEIDPAQVEAALKEEWAQEAVERGFIAMVQAIDPESRGCIAALLALYLKNRRAPDRIYKRVGGLFSETIGEDLALLRSLSGSVIAVAAAKGGVYQIIHFGISRDGEWGCVWSKQGSLHTSARFSVPPYMNDLLQLMARHGVGASPQGLGSVPPEGYNERFAFRRGEHIDAIEIMQQCLGADGAESVVVEESSV